MSGRNFNRTYVALLAAVVVMCCGCGNGSSESINSVPTEVVPTESVPTEAASQIQSMGRTEADKTIPQEETMHLYVTVGNTVLTANFEDNTSAEALAQLLMDNPLTVQMSDYAGMEKVGAIGTSLPRNDRQIDVGAGDIILYQGNQITIYYGTNSWNFTKLATIENVTGDELLKILGSGDAEVTFSVE